jgi:hypothetical protein
MLRRYSFVEGWQCACRQPAAPLRHRLPARLGRAETGAKMTATWQLHTLPPTYIVCPLIETS